MADKTTKRLLLECLVRAEGPLSISEIRELLPGAETVPARTLRRWLSEAVDQRLLLRHGEKRGTRYEPVKRLETPSFKFLRDKTPVQREQILKNLRDLWTHHSTALEGNTLTLGDTHFLLEEGLTVSGKPIREHQEVIGHAAAITLMYRSLSGPVTESTLFELHRAVQTEVIHDAYKPCGAWKVEPNGTYTINANNESVYLEYAHPRDVPALMAVVLQRLNTAEAKEVTCEDAPLWYATIHTAIAHIHPFWDGNGRIARLIANLPLLQSGLPPVVIPKERRRQYIQLLAEYELHCGTLTTASGAWPRPEHLAGFTRFIAECYQLTRELLEA
jgi:Fic family protein